VRAQLNEVAANASSNSAVVIDNKLKLEKFEEKDEPTEKGIPDAAAISAFMAQASNLVKLVDSRDIVELHLKQSDCELIIRKNEALPQPAPVAPIVSMPPPMQHFSYPPPPPPAPAAASPPPPAAAAPALLAPPKAALSSQPTLKCPMAGTFYRCSGPGEPPFVKVGDKVQKGQVICIIEAMKLMNEIEADQSGTITDILVEDAKPVSVDMPLFVIAP
jgi:acetyl-CoA carboxylase biotin carboxyl carrier protein